LLCALWAAHIRICIGSTCPPVDNFKWQYFVFKCVPFRIAAAVQLERTPAPVSSVGSIEKWPRRRGSEGVRVTATTHCRASDILVVVAAVTVWGIPLVAPTGTALSGSLVSSILQQPSLRVQSPLARRCASGLKLRSSTKFHHLSHGASARGSSHWGGRIARAVLGQLSGPSQGASIRVPFSDPRRLARTQGAQWQRRRDCQWQLELEWWAS
jgi:hypothetical protein